MLEKKEQILLPGIHEHSDVRSSAWTGGCVVLHAFTSMAVRQCVMACNIPELAMSSAGQTNVKHWRGLLGIGVSAAKIL